jgi:acetylornithine deacetylase/succinyl-diaminopimelate desuccinylase-like protein
VSSTDKAIAYANDHRDAHLDELRDLVAIPSISTVPESAADIRRAARWLCDWITAEGARGKIIETGGNPLVWGEFAAGSPDAPSVLLYGHYDVQPVDPIDLWDSDPFEPTIRGDRLYARGASDMKAQIMAALFAVRSLRRQGELPVTVRVLFEGEEEIGSPSLAKALEKHAGKFKADVCLNPDVGMLGPELPTIRYGLRGLAYFELHITGPVRDLHSGAFGGVVHNPAQALAEIITGMHDANGRVTLPGFYDRVREIDAAEKDRFARVPFGDAQVESLSGVSQPWGEKGFSPAERVGARPTLEINGMVSGYTGHGAKTVIPSTAMAKISTRLVPDQRHEEIRGQLEAYLKQNVPPTVSWEVRQLAGGASFICDPASPAHTALSAALTSVWGVAPILSRSGGSVPVASDLQELLGVPSVLTGFALPNDQIHSPNESQHLPTWYRGIEAFIRFFENFGRG